jgi:hypothetical protein
VHVHHHSWRTVAALSPVEVSQSLLNLVHAVLLAADSLDGRDVESMARVDVLKTLLRGEVYT